MDLVVIVRGKNRQAVLSWPEICNMDSEKTIIALSAEPVPPLTKETPKKELFPRLVLGGDFYADRFIDGVYNIEVINPAPPIPFTKGKHIYVSKVAVTGDLERSCMIDDISRYRKINVTSKQSGHDPGYFGIVSYSGASLLEIFEKEGIKIDSNTVILAVSSDGYRASVSYGELALSPGGKNIILADKCEGKPFGELGKFNLIFPDDYNADRWIKHVSAIKIIKIKPEPRIYVVGVGCGDSSLLTLYDYISSI